MNKNLLANVTQTSPFLGARASKVPHLTGTVKGNEKLVPIFAASSERAECINPLRFFSFFFVSVWLPPSAVQPLRIACACLCMVCAPRRRGSPQEGSLKTIAHAFYYFPGEYFF